MNPTEYLIRRPASAIAVALLLVAVGAAAFYFGLPWRGAPSGDAGTIVVRIDWPGADAGAVERAIAQPAQRALAGIDAVASIDARSSTGAATIEVHLRRHADVAAGYGAVQARLRAMTLPADSRAPQLFDRADSDAMLIAISGLGLNEQRLAEISATASTLLGGVPGVARVRVLGGGEALIRIGFDAARANALGVTIGEVERVLAAANVADRGGILRGPWSTLEVQAGAPLTHPRQLAELVVRADAGQPIKLADVATIAWTMRQSGAGALLDGKTALALAIDRTIDSNALSVSAALQAVMPRLGDALPPGLQAEILYDAAAQDRADLERGLLILAAAVGAAVLAVWVMLGWWRAGIVPALAAAIALAASCLLWWVLGGSFNPVALLAAIVGMGLVADDAMTVVEDVDRQLREGKPPMLAPLFAARHLMRPTVATTLTVAALFTPFALGLQSRVDWIGEFALALALTALVSGLVSLTLAPALCARFLRYRVRPPSLGRIVETLTRAITNVYDRALVGIMARRAIMALLMLVMAGAVAWMWESAPREGAPAPDRSALRIEAVGPANADRAYLELYAARIDRALAAMADVRRRLTIIDGDGAPLSLLALLKPAEQRQKSARELAYELQPTLDRIIGVSAWGQAADGNLPIELMISAPHAPRALTQALDGLIEKARASGLFAFVDGTPRLYRPVLRLEVDRDKAAALGVPIEAVGRSLGTLLDGRQLGAIEIDGVAIPVVLQAKGNDGQAPAALEQYFVRTARGQLVPLLELVTLRREAQPATLLLHDGRSAALLRAVPARGVSPSMAGEQLRAMAASALPKDFTIGPQRGPDSQDELTLLIVAGMALVAAFLVLAALVENFRDALAILVGSVPALFAALAVPMVGLTGLNGFSLAGLLCAFAFSLRQSVLLNTIAIDFQAREGLDRARAVGLAALQRLRPALIGALTMVAVLLPMALIEGPAQELRQALAWPLLSGVGIGTLLMALFTPPVFSLLAANHRAPQMADVARSGAALRNAPIAPAPMAPVAEAPRPLRPVSPLPKPVRKRRNAAGGDIGPGADDEKAS